MNNIIFTPQLEESGLTDLCIRSNHQFAIVSQDPGETLADFYLACLEELPEYYPTFESWFLENILPKMENPDFNQLHGVQG